MNEKKEKLLLDKEKLEERIKKYNAKLKIINQEITNIELKEKSNSTDEIINLLEGNGITNANQLIELIKAGKVNINDY